VGCDGRFAELVRHFRPEHFFFQHVSIGAKWVSTVSKRGIENLPSLRSASVDSLFALEWLNAHPRNLFFSARQRLACKKFDQKISPVPRAISFRKRFLARAD
jgi:hypothetical protein